jgi:tetratricopeptide (TPR) repeat protein
MARINSWRTFWWWAIVGLCIIGSMAPGYAQDTRWEATTTAGLQALEQRQYSAAIRQLQAALTLVESGPPDDPRLLTSTMHLATAYSHQKQYPQAALLYQHALALQERLYGVEHPQLLEVLDASIALQRKMHPVRSLSPWSVANRLASRAQRIREREERTRAQEFPGWWPIEERQIFGDGGA